MENVTRKAVVDSQQIAASVEALWKESILARLIDYVVIPSKSPAFDPDWELHGHMHEAMVLVHNWCEKHALPGMELEIFRMPGRTPLLLVEIPGSGEGTVLMYGHLDKQPEMEGWSPGFGPWQPIVQDDRLYGRGAADDGYAVFGQSAPAEYLLAVHQAIIDGCYYPLCD